MTAEELAAKLAEIPDGPGAEEMRRQLLKEQTEA